MLFYVIHYDDVHYDGTTWVDQHVKNAMFLSCPLLHGSRGLCFVNPQITCIVLAQISLTGAQLSGLGAHLSGISSYLNTLLTGAQLSASRLRPCKKGLS